METLKFKARNPDAEIYQTWSDVFQLRVPDGRKMKIYSYKTFDEAYTEYTKLRDKDKNHV